MNRISNLTLNNGITMPCLGLGVLDRANRASTAAAVEAAIADGYRLIDTAASYLNEREVGEGLARSGVARADLFVTTKVWMSDYGEEKTLHAYEASLGRLGLDYIDLYLLHWPVPLDFEATIAAYKVLEKLLAEGRVRAIGVSNFSAAHLENLMAQTEIVPAVNQVELNPSFQQKDLRAAHRKLGIVTQAWSPIGGGFRRSADQGSDPIADPVIAGLAQKHGRTAAQIILRWHIQNGVSVVPKSFNPKRIVENRNVFDFELPADDMAAINALDKGLRTGPDPETTTAAAFDIAIED
ncbi:aldo/keto reductase [uncultured Martelella sp.]|uniref:aldo/keto reductase n=1 Tax=uncultured Martelella sp. TaxID=392331 RepID=UPI0029C82737|nr:aldo/keto reductase [uncultured Martelella sp.]